jgi:alkylhydroperoxidase family enzyme
MPGACRHRYRGGVPHIEEIPPERAAGATKRAYDDAMRRAGRVWNIVSIMSVNGQTMGDSMRFYSTVMFGDSPLTRAQREMIAVVTSQANECHY